MQEELWCYPTKETYPEDCMPTLRNISGQFGLWSSHVYVVVGNSCDTAVQHIHACLWIMATCGWSAHTKGID
jgi:hypothetical protein